MGVSKYKNLIIVVVVLVTLVSFWGFYLRKTNFYLNIFQSEARVTGCSPADSYSSINESISLSVAGTPWGSDNSFVWEARGGNPSSGETRIGETFRVSYSSRGNYEVTVRSSSDDSGIYGIGRCRVHVGGSGESTPTPTPTPVPSSTPTSPPRIGGGGSGSITDEGHASVAVSCNIPTVPGRIIKPLTLYGSDCEKMWSEPYTGVGDIQRGTCDWRDFSVIPVSELVPGRQYRVTLESFDNHIGELGVAGHGGQGQTREQFYVNTRIGISVGTGQTGISQDISDGENYKITEVPGLFSVSAAPDNMYAAHAFPDDGAPGVGTNSLTAVCVAFDPVEESKTVSGRVYNKDTNQGISGITIGTCQGPNQEGTTTTNTDGRYSFNVTTPPYGYCSRVLINPEGYSDNPETNNNPDVPQDSRHRYEAQVAGGDCKALPRPSGCGELQILWDRETDNDVDFRYAIVATPTPSETPTPTPTPSETPTPTPTFTPTPTPPVYLSMRIEKLGQNLSAQGPQFNNRVDASPGNIVRFQLTVNNDSNTRVTNIIVRDTLPAELTYEPGTTFVGGSLYPDGITGNGISIGALDQGDRVVVVFNVKVGPESSFQTGTTVLLNGGYARADGISERESKIPIYVTKNILVPVGTVETGIDGATGALLASLILTFGYHFARSGISVMKSGISSVFAKRDIVPDTKMLATVAVIVLLIAGALLTSNILESSSITQIEIRNPVVHNQTGEAYFGQIGR